MGPGEQVDAGQGEFQPGLVDGEQAGGEPAEAAVFAGADAVFYAGVGAVAGFQELDRPAAGRGVGGHDLVAHAFDGVEQGQLRAGVRAFAAHDEPGAFGVAVGGDEAGDLADFGPVA